MHTSNEEPTGATGITASEMTKQAFVTTMNNGIRLWREGEVVDGVQVVTPHPDYDDHIYIYQASSYPRLSE